MKYTTIFLAFLLAVFALGCDKPDTTSQKLDKVQEKAAEAALDMKDYTFAQKAAFTTKMQIQLAEINKDLDQLTAKIEKFSEAAKAEAKSKFQGLREKAAKLDTQLAQAKNATESTWDSVKATSKEAYADLKDSLNQARQWASDKLAP